MLARGRIALAGAAVPLTALAGCSATPATAPFPSVATAKLSATQQRVVAVAKSQFEHPQASTVYSAGVKESWCADFVSWVMKKAGTPQANPNSGGWRIPGVYTLQDYFTKAGRFHRGGSDYRPSVGDVVMYDKPNPFGNHTNLVVATDGEAFTTVGGNQPGGITVTTQHVIDAGILGFGSLPSN